MNYYRRLLSSCTHARAQRKINFQAFTLTLLISATPTFSDIGDTYLCETDVVATVALNEINRHKTQSFTMHWVSEDEVTIGGGESYFGDSKFKITRGWPAAETFFAPDQFHTLIFAKGRLRYAFLNVNEISATKTKDITVITADCLKSLIGYEPNISEDAASKKHTTITLSDAEIGDDPLSKIESARRANASFYIEKSTSIYNYKTPDKYYSKSTSNADIEFPVGPLNLVDDKVEIVFLNTVRNKFGETIRVQRVKTFVDYKDVRWY